MLDLFLKLLKWYISVAFFIGGVYFLRLTMDGDAFYPIIFAIFCFGIVFWSSKATYEAPRIIAIGSMALLAATGFLTYFLLLTLVFYLTGILLSFYLIWAASIFVLGIPVMGFLFKKA